MNHLREHLRNKVQPRAHLDIGVPFLLQEARTIYALVEHMDLVLGFLYQNVLDHAKQDAAALKDLLRVAQFHAQQDITA